MPLLWEELEHVYPTDFTILNVPDRLAKTGDPWQGILTAKHDLRRLLSEEPEAADRSQKASSRKRRTRWPNSLTHSRASFPTAC